MEPPLSPDEVQSELAYTIKRLLEFPGPKICKHYAGAQILTALIKLGFDVPQELAEAVVNADDETAIKILNQSILPQ